jgi:cytoskeletal protein RodZ
LERLGEYLKKERETRNISLEEISKKTCINIKILQALENDDKSNLPGDTFNRGFLKAYAKHVGLDETDVLHRYDQFYQDYQMPYEEYKREVVEDFYGKKSKKLLITLILLFILTALVFVIYNSGKKEIKTGEVSGEEVLAEKQDIAQQSAAKEEAEKEPEVKEEKEIVKEQEIVEKEIVEEQAIAAEHKIVLKADDLVWIDIQIDDDEPYEITLSGGEVYKKTANQKFELKIGNAGKLRIEFDGEDLGVLGKEKEVRNITLP